MCISSMGVLSTYTLVHGVTLSSFQAFLPSWFDYLEPACCKLEHCKGLGMSQYTFTVYILYFSLADFTHAHHTLAFGAMADIHSAMALPGPNKTLSRE